MGLDGAEFLIGNFGRVFCVLGRKIILAFGLLFSFLV